MSTILMAFVALTLGISLLWHNKSPRAEDDDSTRSEKIAGATRRADLDPRPGV